MLEDDGNAANEFTTMSSAIKSTLKWGDGGLWECMLIICKQERTFNTQSACVSTTSGYDWLYQIKITQVANWRRGSLEVHADNLQVGEDFQSSF